MLLAALLVQDYTPGHQALELWNAEGRAAAPLWVQVWLRVMMISFAASLIFVWRYMEARLVALGIGTGYAVSKLLVPALGLTPLSGLAALNHLIFWTPPLIILLRDRPWTHAEDDSLYARAYRSWSLWIVGVIAFSFLFDIRDAAIYLDHILGLGVLN